ncbi:MAG: hypothetical protein GX606_02545 [Elusimicrobia bacterium]|nr:hypothetical protein [Elusimicrobiota bacterium]
MRAWGLLRVAFFVTIAVIFYIHIQMNTYALAYKGKLNQHRIEALSEENSLVENEILRIQSSDNIGRKLLAKDKNYQFAGRGHVMEAEERPGTFISPLMTLAFSPGAGQAR